MKKMSVLITIILLITILFSCGKLPDGETTPAETTQQAEVNSSVALDNDDDTTAEGEIETASETEAFPETLSDITVHYISGSDGLSPQLICSADEFKEYSQQAEMFVVKAEVQTVIDRFDEMFWENYDLVIVKITANSGSFRHEVSSMTREKSGNVDWTINVRVLIPGAYSQDMAAWTFMMEVPKGAVNENDVLGFSYTEVYGTK